MTGVVEVHTGAIVALDDGDVYVVVKFRSAEMVLVEHRTTFKRKSVHLSDLRAVQPKDDDSKDLPPERVTDDGWEAAREKANAVDRVFALGGGEAVVRQVASECEVHPSTLYRWIESFSVSRRVMDLYRKPRNDAGKTRLGIRIEALIRQVIRDFHRTHERPSVTQSYGELERRCKLRKLRAPSIDTFKARLAICDQRDAAKARGETRKAHKLRLNKGSLEGGNFPYALVQIDHTYVDIQLVDGEHRMPIGRPWITVAIDVFSRMCLGYYISFDPPGMLGTGLCLTHAIRNKQEWMAKLGVDYDYPCQGVPRIVHADNAKEFRGKSLQAVCDLHHIDLRFRKKKKPQHGAYIERYMGTLMSDIHALPGTTFSNVVDKEDYDSEGKAVFTLPKFERWLAHLILGQYHHRPHSGLNGLPPIVVFKRGIAGEDGLPTGSLRIEPDERRLYLDFLPQFERTVQQHGVQVDEIHYSADVLRRWVGARDPQSPRKARLFVFKRDPRDIAVIYFKDPETNIYSPIPYRTLSNPHMSIWELERVRKYLKDQGKKEVNEEVIMAARNEMVALRDSEAALTAAAKKGRYSRSQRDAARRRDSPQPEFGHRAAGGLAHEQVEASSIQADAVASSSNSKAEVRANAPFPGPVKPYDEIEDY